ncbi:NAD(P)H-dependent oxidoreductase [Aquibacillus sp. 3ASR75-11]|uniref:NAD(P)H-dependent oxidoreductase n=1 Tax=Terrihalobacillus insolitus TaxID=2950438 RepID=A0A9X4AKJ8_9BACI|nr:NAD(P)H-dependent oxidoreductase [Terrihalobacillus insolitus]MDC3412131.1 NAD(P)H-dependent oxidoreductase [Terrihalobacillus insolitus]MDC3423176.1 NAD(P)H-dependent oxidoreductase [Terrihalobacillus insolitus]
MKIVGISGSLTPRSKTFITVEKALNFAEKSEHNVETELINLRDYHLQFCDGRDPSTYEGDTKQLIDKIVEADALIVGSPIYRGSISGALKNVFDLIPNDSLRGKVIGFIATGGTYHHYLAIEHQLKPLAGYFKAHVIPGNVYAHNQHFENKQLVDKEIITRLKELGETVVTFHDRLNREAVGAHQPSIPRKSLLDS